MEVATSLCVESSFRDRNSEPLQRGPRARAARRTCVPLDSTDGVLGKRAGFSGAISALAHGIQGSRKDQKAEEEEEDWQEQQTRSKNPTLQEQNLDDQPTNDREARSKPPRPSLL